MSPSPFAFDEFWDRALPYAQAGLDFYSPTYISHVPGMAGTWPPQPSFCWLRWGISWTFCLVWLGTMILPISTSQVTRITGFSHCSQPGYSFLTVPCDEINRNQRTTSLDLGQIRYKSSLYPQGVSQENCFGAKHSWCEGEFLRSCNY
jgi:hypothetical protein